VTNEERLEEDEEGIAAGGAGAAGDDAGEDAPGLEVILDYLHRSRGFDFTGYKRTTVARRIRRRMSVLGVMTYPEYVDYLEVRPDELPQLFNTILDQLAGTIRSSLATGIEGEQVLDCMTRRGKALRCRITVTPMKADPTRGVTLVVDEASP
jgi:hypothetical protein